MKRLSHFFFLLLLCSGPLLAQKTATPTPKAANRWFWSVCVEDRGSYQQRADSMLAALDRTEVYATSGYLYDRTAGTAYLDLFNHAHNDVDTSNIHHFLQAYYELRVANYSWAFIWLPCRQMLADHADYVRRSNTILLGALRYRFHTLDTLAVRDGLLSWDTSTNPPHLLDVPGRARSPYVLHEVAVAAALADSLAHGGSASFRLDPAYLFTNTGQALTSASIDFDDGNGARTLTPGQTVAITYGSRGWKALRYTLTYADGTQFVTYSRLWVPVASVACTNCRIGLPHQKLG